MESGWEEMTDVLIVTDIQNGFMNELTRPLINKIKTLLESNLFNCVIFTQFVNTPDSPYVRLIGYTDLQDQPRIDIVSELRSYAQNVFVKHQYTPFTKEFEDFLKINRLTHLYFVGVDTNACVQAGAVGAFERGYVPLVLAEYCASHSGDEFHESAIKNLQKLIGEKQVIFGELTERFK